LGNSDFFGQQERFSACKILHNVNIIKLFNYPKMHGVLLKLMLMLNPMLLQADQAQLITGQDSVLPLQ